MAINLNLDRYGAQFNAFVDFASTQRNPGWIACVEGQKPGQGMLGQEDEGSERADAEPGLNCDAVDLV